MNVLREGVWLVLVAHSFTSKVEEVRNANGKNSEVPTTWIGVLKLREAKGLCPEQGAWLGAILCNASEAAARLNCSWKSCSNAMCFCPHGTGRKSLEICTPQMRITHLFVPCLSAGEVSSDWGSCLAPHLPSGRAWMHPTGNLTWHPTQFGWTKWSLPFPYLVIFSVDCIIWASRKSLQEVTQLK